MRCHHIFVLIEVFFIYLFSNMLELYNKDNYYYYIIEDTLHDN